ncbi:Non-catalytic module family EXPN protein [Hysterangium stoloniferum]|nr:Non-catalytic module family EXPN protein [Hysterangium stoloniferum]
MANPLPNTTPATLSARASGDHYGKATFFLQNGVAGACGKVHRDNDHVVALETAAYAGGNNCGRTISITDTYTGKSVTGVIADECPTCGNRNNIDLSSGLFTQFTAESVGEFSVVWKFV